MNLNKLARDITLIEGKRKSMSIAQVKEVLKIILIKFANEYTLDEIYKTIKKYEVK